MAAYQVEGLASLLGKLRTLPVKLQKKALRAAMRKGANVIKDAAKATAKQIDDPETSEAIYKNLAVQFSSRKSRQEGGVVMRVGVLGGARKYGNTKENVRRGRAGQTYKTLGDKTNPGGDTWYWRFIELGTSRQPARPFLRPAMEQSGQGAIDAAAIEMNKQLDRLISTNASE